MKRESVPRTRVNRLLGAVSSPPYAPTPTHPIDPRGLNREWRRRLAKQPHLLIKPPGVGP